MTAINPIPATFAYLPLSGGTVSGATTFNGGVTLPNGTPGISASQYSSFGNTFTGTSNIIPPRLNLGLNLAGTIAGQSYVNYLFVSGDSADAHAGANGGLFTLGLVHNITGTATVKGGRGMVWSQMNIGALTNGGLEMLGLSHSSFVTGDTNGAFVQPLATVVALSNGGKCAHSYGEMIVKCVAGSAIDAKGHLLFSYNPGDVVAGTLADATIAVVNHNPAGVSPGARSFISIGSVGGGFPINPNGTMWSITQQTADQNNGRVMNFIPPQCYGGIDFSNVDFSQASGFAFRSPAFSIDGGGQIATGNAVIARTSTGVAVDIPKQIVTAAVVASGGGGSGSGINDYYVGDILFGGSGGLYRVATVTAGAVSAVTILVPGSSASPPANPVTITGGSGVGCTLTLTWAARNTLALQPTAGGTITMPTLQASTTYANDAAAATGGVAVGQLYRNGSALQIRIA